MNLTELIAAAPWREAVTYRETRPHEYVLLQKDGEQELMQAVCQRICDGEAFNGYFFHRPTTYLFIGHYKYWFMADSDTIKAVLDADDDDREVVLNRARLYHDRRDFYIQYGDTGMRDDYPAPPYWLRKDDTRSENDDNEGTTDRRQALRGSRGGGSFGDDADAGDGSAAGDYARQGRDHQNLDGQGYRRTAGEGAAPYASGG